VKISHKYILFSGLAHMKNIMLSPRATVSWIIRNKLEDAEKFVADHNLEASWVQTLLGPLSLQNEFYIL
jgi:hypothetical protein